MAANYTNRLAHEKSPYLLQHAHNPVDWFAWNDEAFAKARAENKPIFLSIGYSTCHWCHVMERESFEDEKIGAFLNEHFVSIKVDREERPDVDKIYMTFVQSTTGGGGWPLNVFLTPDLKPFFGGTYFPPDARHGRPSFLQLLQQIAQLWRERKMEIVAIRRRIARAAGTHHRARRAGKPAAHARRSAPRGANCSRKLTIRANGGFGGAPKFPQPAIPSLLLRAAKRFGDADAVKMVLHTCERMAAGGIHDQLGGGFARYAVDAEWLVPHFEKMLYDNAQLAQLYLDAHLVSRARTSASRITKLSFAAIARDILDYVLRDMTHPAGGFFSAEDADSEGHEGKFYCWTQDELSRLLSPEEFNVAVKFFGITKAGNFVDHSHPQPLPGQNVLSVVNPDVPIAIEPLLDAGKNPKCWPPARNGSARICDDKILASWNGLMLGAFARAGIVLGEQKYLAAAEKESGIHPGKIVGAAGQSGRRKAESGNDRHAFPPLARRRTRQRPIARRLRVPARRRDSTLRSHAGAGASGFCHRTGRGDDREILRPGERRLLAKSRRHERFDFAREGRLRRRGAERQFRRHARAAETRRHHRPRRFQAARRGDAATVRRAVAKAARRAGVHAARGGFLAGRTAPRRHRRRSRIPQIFRNCSAPRTRFISRTKLFWATPARSSRSPKPCSAKNEATVFICTGNSCQPPTSDAAEVRELLR